MSEISRDTSETINEVEQIILLTTCTTKSHRYYRVTLHFLDFQQKKFSLLTTPLLLPLREYEWSHSVKTDELGNFDCCKCDLKQS